MFIVGLNRPYYPSIEEFETLVAAQERFDQIMRADATENGEHETEVYIAEVMRREVINTAY